MAIWHEHGTAIQRVSDRVLYIKVIGAFNKEGALANAARCKEKVLEHFNDGKPWANFHDFTHFELATPDVMDVAEEHYTWCYENGMTHEAFLSPNFIPKDMMQLMLKAFEDKFQFAYFEQMDTALDWLTKGHFLDQENRVCLSSLNLSFDAKGGMSQLKI